MKLLLQQFRRATSRSTISRVREEQIGRSRHAGWPLLTAIGIAALVRPAL